MPIHFLGRAAGPAAPPAGAVDELRDVQIAVIGYDSQARAQALNLLSSGLDVRVGLPSGDPARARARKDRMVVTDPCGACRGADLIALLVPLGRLGPVFDEITGCFPSGATLLLADAAGLDAGAIAPPPDVDVIVLSPKVPGPLLRRTYVAGIGVPVWFEVHRDVTGRAADRARAYAAGIGATEAGIFEEVVVERTEHKQRSAISRQA